MSVKFNEAYNDPSWVPEVERVRGNSIYDRRVSRKGSVVNTNALPPPKDVLVNSDRAYSQVSAQQPDFADLHDEHRQQVTKEAELGFWAGLKTYPKAAAWSLLLSSSIIMEGYDTNLLGSLYAYPTFCEKYGKQLPSGIYEVPAGWQSGLSIAPQIGSILGLALNGWLCDKIGYKKTYNIALAMMTAFIFIVFFAPNVEVLVAGQFLSGVPWGIFQTLSVSYASEVCPTSLRGPLTTYANACWVIGQLLASGLLLGFLNVQDEWSYRIPFAIQWAFIPPIAIGVFFAPESPWWLVRHGYYDQATNVLRRLMSKAERDNEENLVNKLSEMRLTNEHEKALSEGTTYLDLFKGIDLRRTEVSCLTWAAQNMSGSALIGFSTYFYKNAGLPTTQAFNFTLAQYALGLFGTFGAIALMTRLGRRTLYFSGLIAQAVIMAVIGGLGFAKPNAVITQHKRSGAPAASSSGGAQVAVNVGASWAVGSLLLVFTAVFDLAVGPVCYAIVGEVSSTRLRQKTIVIARCVYNICGIFTAIMTPQMLNPGALNWGSKTGLFWAGVTIISIVWVYFRLPETKDRSFGELTILFENKVTARNFKSTKVDQFRSQSVVVQQGAADIEQALEKNLGGVH